MTAAPSRNAKPGSSSAFADEAVHDGYLPILGSNATVHILGLALMWFSPALLACAAIEWGSSTSHDEWSLVISAVLSFSIGFVMRGTTRVGGELRPAQVFSIVAWTWLGCSVMGAVPYVMGSMFTLGQWDSALFESISGFSCSGSTVLTDIEAHGRGVLMWRQLTQWFGGMGVVVLAVTVLPHLGVGGLALMTAEAPGHDSDRLAPRVSETAKRLWALYVGVSVVISLAIWATPGANLYDGVAHGVATAATGGFSPYNASVGHFDSLAVELILVVGMLYCGLSFALHYRVLSGRTARPYLRDGQTKWFLRMCLGSLTAVVLINWLSDVSGFWLAVRDGLFNVVTLASSTGFGNARPDGIGDFVIWAAGAQMVLLILMVVGGSTGSTAGGMKVLRAVVLGKQTVREIRRLKHPRGVFPIKLGRTAVDERIVDSALAFVGLFFAFTAAGTLLISAMGVDLLTASSGVISAMGNMGPALGEAGPTSNFLVYPRPARAVLAMLMLFGRLDLYAILLMFAALAHAGRTRKSRARASATPRKPIRRRPPSPPAR